MSLMDWFKKMMSIDPKVKTNDDKEVVIENKNLYSDEAVEVIHVNPNVYLAHKAARICIGKNVDDDFNKRMKHLEGIIGVNKHETISEHTNSIVLLKIKNEYIEKYPTDYTELFCNMKYCNCVVNTDSKTQYLLIGGSARAFMHIIRETRPENVFLEYIKRAMYSSFEKCFFKSLIDSTLLDGDKCTYLPTSEVSLVESKVTQVKDKHEDTNVENFDAEATSILDPIELENDHVNIVYMSPINTIYEKIKSYGFTLADVYKLATISFVFHDISRSCSHQLVRHRNAISQESQRYVSQENAGFINPVELNKADKYSDRRYKEVLEKTNSIVHKGLYEYKWLLEHKVAKEDARAFLPTNVTTKLMMTMTYINYAYFLNLRLDKSAQTEIRNLAEESANMILDEEKIYDFINYCITPTTLKKRQFVQEISVDDIMEEEYNPSKMEVNTPEAAEELLQKQEKYKEIEKENQI